MLTDILQVHINVTDLDRAVRFYVDVLGMQLVERPTLQWASLSLGGFEIGLFKTEERSPYIERTPNGSRAGATITFRTSDIEADRATLKKGGAVIVDDKVYPWGHVIVFEDTEGNTLRLMTESAERIKRREALFKKK